MLAIGHRGASAHSPENTLSSFRRAFELGADGIELDVRICATGEPIVLHDDDLSRTTNARGAVARATLRDIRAARTENGEPPPTLDEAFAVVGPQRLCFIEIKDAAAAPAVLACVKARIAQGFSWDRLVVIGFDHAMLLSLRQACAELVIGASFERMGKRAFGLCEAMGARYLLPRYRGVTRAHVDEAHRLGLHLVTWTANAPADIARLQTLGVDGIISDAPERVKHARATA